MLRPVTAALLAIALVPLGACSTDEGTAAERFGEESAMYAIQQRGELRVAVPEKAAPFADQKGDRDEGFLVDLGRYIADDLEVDVAYVSADSEEMSHLAADGTVDVAFPLRPVTHAALRDETASVGFAFASPFFVAHQRLLVPEDSGIEQVQDLAGQTVCAAINDETQVDLTKLVDAEIENAVSPIECLEALKRGRVDAVTSPNAALAIMEAALETRMDTPLAIVGDDLNTEGYAAMTAPGSMTTYVIDVLNDVEEDGRWLDSYNRWLAEYLGEVEGPPDLTLQDAAALFPPETSPTP